VATRFRAGQRLKPNSFCILYGTAEAVPYKDLVVATQALQPVGFHLNLTAVRGQGAFTKTHRLKSVLLELLPKLSELLLESRYF
jgi:hypothetical protein